MRSGIFAPAQRPAFARATSLRRGAASMTLETARQDFLKHLRALRRSENTVRVYAVFVRSFINHAIHECGHDRLSAFTPTMVESWVAHLSARGLADISVNHHQTGLQSFARWGRKRRYWVEDPTLDMEMVRRPQGVPRPFTQDERDRLMALPLDATDRAIRALLYYTGLRCSEICQLQVRDVVRPGVGSDGQPTLATVTVRQGKGKKDRVLAMHPTCWAALEDHGLRLTDNSPRAFLFAYTTARQIRGQELKPEGRPWNITTLERRVRAWGEAARVEDCTPHRWRHTFATNVLEATNDLLTLRDLLGHASVSTTQVYAKVIDRKKAAAVLTLPAFDTPTHTNDARYLHQDETAAVDRGSP